MDLSPGRVIRMRERLWRVDYVDAPVFGASALDGRDSQSRRFHLGLEAVGEGEMPLPNPDALGDETTQRLLLDAHRFSLLHGTAPILGLQRSRAIPTDYQMVPLLLALGADRVRLGIFDDVGTGKTVEAGLVLSELLARGKARRVLIVVPANLREQWREALDHFFHLDATIVSGTLLPGLERRLLPGQSVWGSHDIVIASIDYLKTRSAQVRSYPWDLVLIDEAHLCAQPHAGSPGGKPDMARWQFAEQICAHAAHAVLLTATPHNGYSDSYASLFRMLDPALVSETAAGPRIDRRRARHRHIVQRRRGDIEEWYRQRGGRAPFPRRDADEVLVDLRRAPQMLALLDELRGYADDLYRSSTSTVDRWIAAHLQKRALSSPAALRESVRNRARALERRAAAEPGRGTLQEAREATGDRLFAENDEGDAAGLDRTASGLDREAELGRLRAIAALAEAVTPARDPKLQALLALVPQRLVKHPAAPRVLVFTKFKDTLDYLVRELGRASAAKGKALPQGLQVFAIDGQMNLAQRRETFARFEAAAPAVLVATDCISEGLNLQRACAELVHYELPWNPNRLEQRNGRIDRFQQREPSVGIRTLVLDDPLDAALLYLIDKKAEQMRSEYGFVPPFLANPDILLHLSDPTAAYRARLQERARGGQMTLFDEEDRAGLAELDPELARLAEAGLSGGERVERMVQESFYGQADVSLATVEAALTKSREETGSPEAIREFVLTGLRRAGAAVDARPDGTFTVADAPADLRDAAAGGAVYTFDPLTGMDDPDLDVVDLAHPLARRLVDLAIERAQLPECAGRVAMRVSPAAATVTVVAHVLFRYVAHGSPPVLLEELVPLAWERTSGRGTGPGPLLHGPPGAGGQARADIVEDAREVLDDPGLQVRLDLAAAQRAAALASRHADLSADWAAGLADVEATSRDLVALTLVYPEVPR